MAEITHVWLEEAASIDESAVTHLMVSRGQRLAMLELRYLNGRLALDALQRFGKGRTFKRDCETWEFLFNNLHKALSHKSLEAVYSLVIEHGGSCVKLSAEVERLRDIIKDTSQRDEKETWWINPDDWSTLP